NSLLITDTRYSLSKIEKMIDSLDVYVPIKEIFTVKHALAEELLDRVKSLLSEAGKAEVDKITNTIILIDSKDYLEKIKLMLASEDTIEKQTKAQSFSLKYAQANSMGSVVKDLLTPSGKLEADPSINSLLITDTRYSLMRIGQLISKLDHFRPSERFFEFKFALASEVAEIARPYLSDKGKIEVNETENQIMVTDTSRNLKKIEELLADLDTPQKQMKKEKFLIKYTSLKDLAEVVKESLSPEGKLRIDPSSSTLTVQDSSYHLFQIEKIVARLDIFQPRKKTYKISFAPLSLAKEKVEDLISDKGTVEIQKETSSLVVVDVKKSLDDIDKLVKEIDTLEGQLVTKRFFLKYLTPQEAKSELQAVISEHGKIHLPQAEGAQSRSSPRDYIIIPQEKVASPEENNRSDQKTQVENNIIYVTDLKRNIPRIEEVVKEMKERAEEVAVRNFYIKEGSLERIAIAIANMLGVPPEEIQGIELKKEEGKWMEMEVPSPSVNLGTIGPGE
ncbi:MAG: secretin N-terminal domain-containing protein, partial [bacterium]